jgi:UDP-glucose 4-epimerase
MKILITGGAGFIGSNFAHAHKKDYEVFVLDNLFLGTVDNLDSQIHFIEGDACNVSDLDKVGPVDYVLHLAGTSSAPMFMDDGFVDGYVNSVTSFVTVLDWARKNKVKKVLYASTSSLYANNPMPLTETQNISTPNHYAVTKHLYENCAQCYNRIYPEMDIIGFRFMSIYGPNEEAKGEYANLISQFCWDMSRDLSPVIYGDGTQTRDFTNVADVVQALSLAMKTDKKLGADVFNVGTGNSVSVNDIVQALNKALKKDIQAKYIKNPVKEAYIQGQHADISKISNVLGYNPKVVLEEGIAHQVSHLRLDRVKKTSSENFR